MVKTYKSSLPEVGKYKAMVTEVIVQDNNYYDLDKPEGLFNCPSQLEIEFVFEDGRKWTQPFVNPAQDYGLFGDLCAIAKVKFGDEESEETDEQEIVGTECLLVLEEVWNKDKTKSRIKATQAFAPDVVDTKNPNATEEEKENAVATSAATAPFSVAKKAKAATKKAASPANMYQDKQAEEAAEVFGIKQKPIVAGPEKGEWLVPSASVDGKYHTVRTNGSDILSCSDCIGFKNNGKCSHGDRVIVEKLL